MDNQNLPQQSQIPQPNPLPITSSHKPNYLLLGIGAIIFLAIGFGTGYFVKGSNHVTPQQIKQTIKPSPTQPSTPTPNVLANWQSFTSKNCNFTVKTPPIWKAIPAQEDTERYNYECLIINAPDFRIVGMDSDDGLSLHILRTKIGTIFQGVTIQSLTDYITATENITSLKAPATNISKKTIGEFNGEYFEYEAYRNMAHFIFEHGDYIYTIWWRANYQGEYQPDIDKIISSIQFN